MWRFCSWWCSLCCFCGRLSLNLLRVGCLKFEKVGALILFHFGVWALLKLSQFFSFEMIRVFFFSVCLFVLVRGRILVIKREFCFISNDAPKKIGGIVVFGIQVVMNPSNFLFLTQKFGIWGQIGKNSQPREINLWCDQIMACSGKREKHILRNQKWDKTDWWWSKRLSVKEVLWEAGGR